MHNCEWTSSGDMAKEAPSSVIAVNSGISSTALEKKMNEQMSKGNSMVVSSSSTDQNAADTSMVSTQTTAVLTLSTETVLQKSPPKVNNNA